MVDVVPIDFFNLLNNPYVLAAFLLMIFVIVVNLIMYIVNHLLVKMIKSEDVEIDDEIVRRSKRPLFWTLFVIGIKLSMVPITISAENLSLINKVIDSFLVIFICYTIYVITNTILEYYVQKINKHTNSNFHNELLPFINHSSKVVYIALGMVFVLRVWDINIQPFLAGLGIFGLAIGLAMQSTLSNIIGGIALLLDKNFNLGDEIKLENEIEGTVLDIGLRSTKIRTKNHELIIIPNNTMAASKITNYAKPTTMIRVSTEFELERGTDVQKVLREVEKKSSILKFIEKGTHAELSITNITQGAIKAKIYFWVNLLDIERTKAQEQLSLLVYGIIKKK